jgi:hypothetical protein
MLRSRAMRCAVIQPSYIPWRGYFDIMRRVDLFVFYDDVQYDRRGWRNRNRVKSPNGPLWLTIPVRARGAQLEGTPICAIETDGSAWAAQHYETLRHLYSRAPHFHELRPWLEQLYATPPSHLADFTIRSTIALAERLGLKTRFVRSSELNASGAKTERLIQILQRLGATHYLTGPSARHYIDEERFAHEGITLEWMSYEYPEYPQLYGPYDPHVSILDLLFMTGDRALEYLLPALPETAGSAVDIVTPTD